MDSEDWLDGRVHLEGGKSRCEVMRMKYLEAVICLRLFRFT